jgi:hypothetical protein
MRKRATPLVVCGLAVGVLGVTAVRDLSYAGEAPAPRSWRYERMRPADLTEALKERPIAWLVVSPLEWHGEALSFGCDPHVAQTVADLAWEKTGGVRMPTLYLGVETDYEVWEGDKRVDYWGMELGTRERNPGSVYVRPLTLELFYPWDGELPAELRFDGAGQHADFDEASVLGGADPAMVDRSRFGVVERDRRVKLLRENAGRVDFDKGRRIIEYRAAQLQKQVEALVKELGLPTP